MHTNNIGLSVETLQTIDIVCKNSKKKIKKQPSKTKNGQKTKLDSVVKNMDCYWNTH
jgi:hypothetical protein